MQRYTLHNGDCLEFMSTLSDVKIDAVITDPPYPDYHADKYKQTPIDFLRDINCRQLVFWSAKLPFPLDYTAAHVWDKKVGCGSQYEMIYERNGGKSYRVFRHYLINSNVAASFTGDVFTGHPSQKPAKLLKDMLEKFTKPGALVFDPFAGSGSTGVACLETGRRFIGCEINPDYYEIARRRLEQARAPLITEG